jgi:hypothetical protein
MSDFDPNEGYDDEEDGNAFVDLGDLQDDLKLFPGGLGSMKINQKE